MANSIRSIQKLKTRFKKINNLEIGKWYYVILARNNMRIFEDSEHKVRLILNG